MKKIIFTLLLFLAWPANAYYDLGEPLGFVNDYGEMISRSEEQLLNDKLSDFEKESSNEIVIVTIPNLGEDTIENFAVDLFSDWGIGKTDNDNGILLLISRDDRQMRIEVGYGLEGALTDAQSYWIINDVLKPAFQRGNYYLGMNNATDKIIEATQGEYLPERFPKEEQSREFNFEFLFWIFIFIVVMLASILGTSKSWWAGGVLGGVVGIIIGLVKGFIYLGIVSIVILVPLGLLFDFIVSRSYKKHKAKRSKPWWTGGGSGGSSGSGSSGGGFGGFGGGSSGGGGASGGW